MLSSNSILTDPEVVVSEKWSSVQKTGFRFIFVFFSLFIIFENNNAFPFWRVPHFLQSILDSVVVWTGRNLLGISRAIIADETGSGDTTFVNIMVLWMIMIALSATVLWSLIDRNRTAYRKLYYWLTVAVRYYIALMLFGYGMVKVIKLQFPYPDIYRMSESYGNSSPMGLAWTFFGYSKGYNWFVGVAEVLSLLLLFRRTLALGALITLITTVNIMAINYFFDVPVKLLSTMLVLMTLFLLARDLRKIFAFFLSGKSVCIMPIEPPVIERKWLRICKYSAKFILIAYSVCWSVATISQAQSRDDMPKSRMYGLYEINEVMYPTDTVNAPHSKIFPWKQVVIAHSNQVTVRMMNDSVCKYSMHIFTPDTTMTLIPVDRRFEKMDHVLKYDMTDTSNIQLRGKINGDSVLFILHRIAKSEKDFRLDSTEFHWISDKPNNK